LLQRPDVRNQLLHFKFKRPVVNTPDAFVLIDQQKMFGMQKFGAVFAKSQLFFGKVRLPG
jgi:hypothetical protein